MGLLILLLGAYWWSGTLQPLYADRADRQGRIFTVKVGELGRDEAKIILDGLRDVDSGGVDLKTAQQQIATKMAQLEAAARSR